jgi:hypothetical protein
MKSKVKDHQSDDEDEIAVVATTQPLTKEEVARR